MKTKGRAVNPNLFCLIKFYQIAINWNRKGIQKKVPKGWVLKTLCKASYPSGLARLYQSAIILIQFVCYRSEDLPSPYGKAIVNPAMTILTIDISLMRMLSDGPEVSLNGSPTVSPTMVALWFSLPLPPK